MYEKVKSRLLIVGGLAFGTVDAEFMAGLIAAKDMKDLRRYMVAVGGMSLRKYF